MLQKLKCFFGFHEKENVIFVKNDDGWSLSAEFCKHCEKEAIEIHKNKAEIYEQERKEKGY